MTLVFSPDFDHLNAYNNDAKILNFILFRRNLFLAPKRVSCGSSKILPIVRWVQTILSVRRQSAHSTQIWGKLPLKQKSSFGVFFLVGIKEMAPFVAERADVENREKKE